MQPTSNQPLFVVIDFRVYAWKIQDLSNNVKPLVDPLTYADWVRACWAIMLNYGPLPLFPDTPNYQVVVVDDDSQTKPYWRSAYLAERGYPIYKGNRPQAKPFGFSEIVGIGLAYVRSPNSPMHYFSYPGYEADDLAGLICQLKANSQTLVKSKRIKPTGKASQPKLSPGRLELDGDHLLAIASREIALCTLDTDWLQLVSPDVTWYNTSHQQPRVRGEAEVLAYVSKQLKTSIDKPKQIVDVKAKRGDSSDNLPPGSPREVIDLLNPPKPHNLIATPVGLSMACLLANPKPNIRLDHLRQAREWIVNQGLPLPQGLGDMVSGSIKVLPTRCVV